MNTRFRLGTGLAVVAALLAAASSVSMAEAAIVTGTASGGRVFDFGSQTGESGTEVFSNAPTQQYLNLGQTYSQAETSFGANEVRILSQPGTEAYGASYWGERFVFTNGLGPLSIRLRFSLEGDFGGDDLWTLRKDNSFNEPPGFAYEGVAGVRWRLFSNFLGESLLDLSSPLFNDPGNSDSFGGYDLLIISDDFEERGILWSNGEHYGTTIGITFNWTYGVPLDVGFLLEAFASDGGYADFFGTGELTGIELPLNTEVFAESGNDYSDIVTLVPEPATMALLALGGLLAVRLRR